MSQPKHAMYVVEIRYSDEDKGYIATTSMLPGCSAWGSTRVECVAEMEHAMTACLAAKKKSAKK